METLSTTPMYGVPYWSMFTIMPVLDVPGVALVHTDLHHHLGGVGNGDALAALDLRPLGEAAGEHRARDGGGGVILAQLVVGRFQLFWAASGPPPWR